MKKNELKFKKNQIVKSRNSGRKGKILYLCKSFPFDYRVRWENGYEEYCDSYELENMEESNK